MNKNLNELSRDELIEIIKKQQEVLNNINNEVDNMIEFIKESSEKCEVIPGQADVWNCVELDEDEVNHIIESLEELKNAL